jgi:hypothetical protein
MGAPMSEWPRLALVSRAWRDSARRVFPAVSAQRVVPVKFDARRSFPEIAFDDGSGGSSNNSKSTRQDEKAIVRRRVGSGYAWAFGQGVPVRHHRVQRCRVVHVRRVQGGGYIGAYVAQHGHNLTAADLRSTTAAVPCHCAAGPREYFVALGTVSGTIVTAHEGVRTEITSQRLQAEEGADFVMQFDATTGNFTFTAAWAAYSHTINLYGATDPPTLDEIDAMRLHWVCSVFSPGTTFSFVALD